MRSRVVFGIVAVLSLWTIGRADARSGAPIVLAQIKLNTSPDTPTEPGTVIKSVKAADVVAVFTDLGVTDINLITEESMQIVEGRYKGVDIRANLGSLKDRNAGDIVLFAFLGQQDTVDQKFMNAFNKNYYVRLYKREDGKIILKLGGNFAKGVTIEYCKDFVQLFVESIDSAAEYKVE